MTDENRLDLRRHATVRNGMLYVERGVVERGYWAICHHPPEPQQRNCLTFREN